MLQDLYSNLEDLYRAQWTAPKRKKGADVEAKGYNSYFVIWRAIIYIRE